MLRDWKNKLITKKYNKIVPNSSKYVRFISLGYDCEISQILHHMFGQVDSYIWSWALCDNFKMHINSMKNPQSILEDSKSLAFNGKGIKFDNWEMSFHSKGAVDLKSDKNGCLHETINRIKHLIQKYDCLDTSEGDIVFLLKINPKFNNELDTYIEGILSALNERFQSYTLSVVLSKEYTYPTIKHDCVEINYVDHYSSKDFTNIDSCFLQWYEIINKYQPVSFLNYTDDILVTFDQCITHFETDLTPILERIIKEIECLMRKIGSDDRTATLNYLKRIYKSNDRILLYVWLSNKEFCSRITTNH